MKLLREMNPAGIDSNRLFSLVCWYLVDHSSTMGYDEVTEWVQFALQNRPEDAPRSLSAFATAIAANPKLLVDLPELKHPELYDVVALLGFVAAPVSEDQAGAEALRQLRDALAARQGYLDIDSTHDMLSMVRKMFRISQIPRDPSAF